MRVLHVNDYRTGGGAEVLMALTMRLLRDEGVEVEAFTSEDLPQRRRAPWRYVHNRACCRALAGKLREFQPDTVHLHNFYHVLSPGILREIDHYRQGHPARIVMTAHDYHLACPNSGATWFGRAACDSIGAIHIADASRLASVPYLLARRWDRRGWAHSTLKLAQHLWNYRILRRRGIIDCVICPSRFIERIMMGAGMPTVFLPHPSPVVARSPNQRTPAHQLRLVFAGRVEPEKGLREFLELLPNEFPGAMTIVGDGGELQRCREVCRRRGFADRVMFSGRLNREHAMGVIAQSHVLVLPSLWWENYPLSLLEALAMGTNILVTDLGGMREVMDTAGVGFTFTPGDAAGLRQALARIVEAHHTGRLNSFVVSDELSRRTESAYLAGLMSAYRGVADSVHNRPAVALVGADR